MQPVMARELFSAGFVSCWSELDNASQQALCAHSRLLIGANHRKGPC